MIQVCLTRRNPTMRHLGRTHRVDIHWLHERFAEPSYQLIKEDSKGMRADIFTKGFTDPQTWGHVLELINHVDPNTWWCFVPGAARITFQPEASSATGGEQAWSPAASASSIAELKAWTYEQTKTNSSAPQLSVLGDIAMPGVQGPDCSTLAVNDPQTLPTTRM